MSGSGFQDILKMLAKAELESKVVEAVESKLMFQREHTYDVNSEEYPMRDGSGWSLLHWAVHNDFHKLATLLLTHGASVNVKDMYGATPIMMACYSSNLPMLKMLLDGPEPDQHGVTSMWRTKVTNTNFNLFAVNNYDSTWFHYAALMNRADVIDLLCDRFVKSRERGDNKHHWGGEESERGLQWIVNAQDKNGDTWLHHVCGTGHYSCIKTLLNHKADPNLTNRVFRNPLEVGLEKNVLSERCYQLLNAVLAKNPPPQMTDKEIRHQIGSLLHKESIMKKEKMDKLKAAKEGQTAFKIKKFIG